MNTEKRYKLLKTGRIKKMFIVLPLFLAFAMISSDKAYAHKVTVFAWAEDDTVYVQSKFGGGRKVNGGHVIVSDFEGKTLLEGETDDQGEFSFKVPQKTDLKISLEAGTGHKGKWIIRAEELGGIAEEKKPAPEKETAMPAPEEPTGRMPQNIGADEIREIVEAAVDKKMKPMLRMLAEARQDQGPKMTDILGGIGYIFGLMGLASYVHHRRKKE